MNPEAEQLCAEGIKAIDGGNVLIALVYFEKAANLDQTPVICSYLGYCLARERGMVKKGLSMIDEAIYAEPRNPVHYLNLGKTLILTSQKDKAIATFREGLRYGKSRQIVQELEKLGVRKEPVLSFLSRDHPINKYLGIILSRLGLR